MEGISIVIWVDPAVDNAENKKYLKFMDKFDYLKVKYFKEVKYAIDEIRKIFFEETLIILSGKLYFDFIEQFKENLNNIYVIPKILVFTSKIDKFKEKLDEYNNMHECPFYISEGIKINFTAIQRYFSIKEKKSNIEEEGQLTIEYIDKIENLALPILFKSLIDVAHYEEIIKFNELIYNNYSKESKHIKNLLKPIKSIQTIPIELISKYYAKIYTAKSKNDDNFFHSIINKDLRENKNDIFLPYIKVLYAGITLKLFPLASNHKLFRGTLLSHKDIETIKENLGKRINGLPGAIIFSKEFLLFHKDKNFVKKNILNKNNNNKDLIKVILSIKKNKDIDYNLSTHADIEKISYCQNEKEVLFLPFSSFEIEKIKEIKFNNEKGYKITLVYLRKYLKKLEESINLKDIKSIINNDNIIPETEFKKQIVQFGLIKPEQINSTKNLLVNYIKYKSRKLDYKTQNNKKFENNNNEIKKNSQINNNNEINIDQDNNIIGEINITEDDIGKKIQIINSYEELKRKGELKYFNYYDKDDSKRENEKEIKANCTIIINDQNIGFSYSYSFQKVGKYKIKYIFKNNLTKLNFMFYNCKSIINLDFSNFNTQDIINMEYMFFSCSSLTNLNLSNFNAQNVINMKFMFYKCKSLSNLDLSIFNTENTIYMEYMFAYYESLKAVNLSNFKTEKVTNMNSMFLWCESLKNLNLLNFNTKNVNDMKYMFSNCHSLTNLNLSSFDTQNVTNMKSMFSDCHSLKKLNLSNFNTKNVTNMELMFNFCLLLTKLNISNFDTKNVIYMGKMFYNCKSLKNLNLSGFNTKNVINMHYMFSKCETLKNLNLSNFDTKNVTEIESMFEECKSLFCVITNDNNIIKERN